MLKSNPLKPVEGQTPAATWGELVGTSRLEIACIQSLVSVWRRGRDWPIAASLLWTDTLEALMLFSAQGCLLACGCTAVGLRVP